MNISSDAQRRKLELAETVALTNDKTWGYKDVNPVIVNTNELTESNESIHQVCYVEGNNDKFESDDVEGIQDVVQSDHFNETDSIKDVHMIPLTNESEYLHSSEPSAYLESDVFSRNSILQSELVQLKLNIGVPDGALTPHEDEKKVTANCRSAGLWVLDQEIRTINTEVALERNLNSDQVVQKTDQNSGTVEIGTILENRYLIIEKIGTGGTATVYKAIHQTLNNVWAVKVLARTDEKLNEHLTEAEILKHLSHPMLPRIADILYTSTHACIVMDYLEGANLLQVINEQGKLPEKNVQLWLKQICDVLTYLHKQKPEPIIYRDLKPSNLIAGKEGHIKLIDFGTARAYRLGVDGDTAYIGTQGYAAPEQFGLQQSDCRTDLYSLGMTMFHLLTGKHPVSVPHGKLEAELVLADISPVMISAIIKCTELLPGHRFQSAQECSDFFHNQEECNASDIQMSTGQNKFQRVMKGRQRNGQTRIAIIGACPGVGVTFFSMFLASFFAHNKQSVAFVELNTSGDLHRLQNALVLSGHLSRKETSFFSFQKIDFHPLCRKLTDIRGTRYQVTISDIGSRPNGSSLEEFFRSEWQFVYCPHADWKTGRVIEFFEKYDSMGIEKQFIYLVQVENEKQLQQLKSLFGNRTVRGIPYIHNPFELTKVEIKKLERFIESIGIFT